eukprot:c19722_g1_i3.p1 GENE.c19722_g1_i3~~c19722_g1_i3.p1  ORF type:complete len:572 (+),score=124.22 c19722_g1_i3:129-1844(+)
MSKRAAPETKNRKIVIESDDDGSSSEAYAPPSASESEHSPLLSPAAGLVSQDEEEENSPAGSSSPRKQIRGRKDKKDPNPAPSKKPKVKASAGKKQNPRKIIDDDDDEGSDNTPTSLKKKRKTTQSQSHQHLDGQSWVTTLSTSVGASRISRLGDNGQPIPSLGELGAKPGDVFVMNRAGEYHGVGIRVLEYCRPLLTHVRVGRAMDLMEQEEWQLASRELGLTTADLSAQSEHGNDITEMVRAVVAKWLDVAQVSAPKFTDVTQVDLGVLDDWIKQRYSLPITCRFEIAALGCNESGSVVPEDWLGRPFENGASCHAEMNKLPWRLGKPPVNFCFTYGLLKQNAEAWISSLDALQSALTAQGVTPGFVVGWVGNQEVLEVLHSEADWRTWCESQGAEFSGVQWRRAGNKQGDTVVVVTDLPLREENRPPLKKDRVSWLVSILQKSIRRGRKNRKLLGHILWRLANSQPYHLPDHQFLRVSACRQMCWRLFVTAIEDVAPYYVPKSHSNSFVSLPQLFCLASICSADSDAVLPKEIVQRIVRTVRANKNSEIFLNFLFLEVSCFGELKKEI